MQTERQIDDSIHGSTNTLRAIEATRAAVLVERERCAKIAEDFPVALADHVERHNAIAIAKQIGALIRNKD